MQVPVVCQEIQVRADPEIAPLIFIPVCGSSSRKAFLPYSAVKSRRSASMSACTSHRSWSGENKDCPRDPASTPSLSPVGSHRFICASVGQAVSARMPLIIYFEIERIKPGHLFVDDQIAGEGGFFDVEPSVGNLDAAFLGDDALPARIADRQVSGGR
jgi:hypothetical protein